jgi:hypothetical protein
MTRLILAIELPTTSAAVTTLREYHNGRLLADAIVNEIRALFDSLDLTEATVTLQRVEDVR